MVYYIEVGKRKTRVLTGSLKHSFSMCEKLQARFGRKVVTGLPKLVTGQFYESEKANREARAVKILALLD